MICPGPVELNGGQVSGNGLGGIKLCDRDGEEAPQSSITGTDISGNMGDGIDFGGAGPLMIDQSSLTGNSGLNVSHRNDGDMDLSTVVAQNNWWGDSGGAGATVSGGVDAGSFLEEEPGFKLMGPTGGVVAGPGATKRVSMWLFQPGHTGSQMVDVSATYSLDWIQTVLPLQVEMINGVAAFQIEVAVPEDATAGMASEIMVTATFADDPGVVDTFTFIVTAYTQILTRLVLNPLQPGGLPGQQIQFSAFAFDQYDRLMLVPFIWSATGAAITDKGLMTAPDSPGSVTVKVWDSNYQMNQTTTVEISGDSRPELVLDKERMAAGRIAFCFEGAPGTYDIEGSRDLVTWYRILRKYNSNGQVEFEDDTGEFDEGELEFYRVSPSYSLEVIPVGQEASDDDGSFYIQFD